MYAPSDGPAGFDIEISASITAESSLAPEPIPFPDKDALFTADFKRAGSDLLLSSRNKNGIIYNYFHDDRRADLVTVEGASLSGATIEALAGPPHPGMYAQATPLGAAQKPIGRVEKVSGSATVLRNGLPVELHLGDAVLKGDVVQTSANSALTIRFDDGTVFALSSSARMVLSDLVYTADSNDNSAFFTLVQGAIGFLAGRIAKTGDFKVETPVATMAIRGTAVQAEISALSGTTRVSLLTEPDGRAGSFVLLDKNNLTRVITSISDANVATIIAPISTSEVRLTIVSKTAGDLSLETALVQELFRVFAEPPQRRGSSDFGDMLVPIRDYLDYDGPNHTLFPIRMNVPQPGDFTSPAGPFFLNDTQEVRESVIEDGPTARLDATSGRFLPSVSIIDIPGSLPPGVSFQLATGTISLNPSHPAYQHLQAGETQTITVAYTLKDATGLFPTSVSWIVTGRNDMPIARNDSFTAGEDGRVLLATGSNDTDIDGDRLNIVQWTDPVEGSISRSASGSLVFKPGDSFKALSAGQTATVSFNYTVSDGNGGFDTAIATIRIEGSGTFVSPMTTASTYGSLTFNQQPVSLTIDAPSQTTATTADMKIAIGLGPVPQPQMNIVFLVDISGSTSTAFGGTPVGDLNGDGLYNTVLDAEIGSLMGLSARIRDLGFSPDDVSVTVIPFNGNAGPADQSGNGQNDSNTGSLTFSLGASGEAAMANYLASLRPGGATSFEAALGAAVNELAIHDGGGEDNLVYFLSDGDGAGSFEDELAILNNVHNAKISAIGIGSTANATLLEMIDNTGGAEIVTTTDQLNASLLGSPLPSGKVVDFDLFLNGQQLNDIDLNDLVVTNNRLTIDTRLFGLSPFVGAQNNVVAKVTFASGEMLTTQFNIAGMLPASTDYVL